MAKATSTKTSLENITPHYFNYFEIITTHSDLLTTRVAHSSVVKASRPVTGRSWVRFLLGVRKIFSENFHRVLIIFFIKLRTVPTNTK